MMKLVHSNNAHLGGEHKVGAFVLAAMALWRKAQVKGIVAITSRCQINSSESKLCFEIQTMVRVDFSVCSPRGIQTETIPGLTLASGFWTYSKQRHLCLANHHIPKI
jgi:hypothetical protein